MKFGNKITDIRVRKNFTLREIGNRLKVLTLESYSKIERNIQIPYDNDEFEDIINALEIKDDKCIKKIKELLNEFEQPAPLTEEEIVQQFPIFFGTERKIDSDFVENMRKMVIESNTPTPKEKSKKNI